MAVSGGIAGKTERIIRKMGCRMTKENSLAEVMHRTREYLARRNGDLTTLNVWYEYYMTVEAKEQEKIFLVREIENILGEDIDISDYVFIKSFLLYATKDRLVYKELLKKCAESPKITKETRFVLYYQFVRFNFLNPEVVNESIVELMEDLYTKIYQSFYEEVQDIYKFIPREERNEDFVVVFSSQVLSETHAPTKTLLDRCYILETELNKKVFIINTAEMYSLNGDFCGFRPCVPSYNEEFCEWNTYPYKDKEFDFFQCPREMPSVEMIRIILEVIMSKKPYYIINIGGSSIVSDMCSNVVPTLTLSTVFSGRSTTRGQFQAVGREINEEDKRWLRRNKLPEDHLLQSVFTFAFKEQQTILSREQLGLPEDGFVVAVIGARLEQEVDETFLRVLVQLMESNMYVVFVGDFFRFDELSGKYPVMKKRGKNLGFQEDVLAVLDCCDLYINPRRTGGGSSAAEALYKGVPVISQEFGDVSVAVGSDFLVEDYEEMYQLAIRYLTEKDFYDIMSRKARERSKRLLDTKGEFEKLLGKMEISPRF